MTDFDHEHQQVIVTEFAEDTVISDTIAPKGAKLGAAQGLPELAWVLERCDPVAQVGTDACRIRRS